MNSSDATCPHMLIEFWIDGPSSLRTLRTRSTPMMSWRGTTKLPQRDDKAFSDILQVPLDGIWWDRCCVFNDYLFVYTFMGYHPIAIWSLGTDHQPARTSGVQTHTSIATSKIKGNKQQRGTKVRLGWDAPDYIHDIKDFGWNTFTEEILWSARIELDDSWRSSTTIYAVVI